MPEVRRHNRGYDDPGCQYLDRGPRAGSAPYNNGGFHEVPQKPTPPLANITLVPNTLGWLWAASSTSHGRVAVMINLLPIDPVRPWTNIGADQGWTELRTAECPNEIREAFEAAN